MLEAYFVKPRQLVEFEPSGEDPSSPQTIGEYYQGFWDERFSDALVTDLTLRTIPFEWLCTGDTFWPGATPVKRTDDAVELTLPAGFEVGVFDIRDEKKIPAETIVMPKDATTTMLLAQRDSGLFICAGIVTVELEHLQIEGPELLQLPHTTNRA